MKQFLYLVATSWLWSHFID